MRCTILALNFSEWRVLASRWWSLPKRAETTILAHASGPWLGGKSELGDVTSISRMRANIEGDHIDRSRGGADQVEVDARGCLGCRCVAGLQVPLRLAGAFTTIAPSVLKSDSAAVCEVQVASRKPGVERLTGFSLCIGELSKGVCSVEREVVPDLRDLVCSGERVIGQDHAIRFSHGTCERDCRKWRCLCGFRRCGAPKPRVKLLVVGTERVRFVLKAAAKRRREGLPVLSVDSGCSRPRVGVGFQHLRFFLPRRVLITTHDQERNVGAGVRLKEFARGVAVVLVDDQKPQVRRRICIAVDHD
jgi:hypothetical protein